MSLLKRDGHFYSWRSRKKDGAVLFTASRVPATLTAPPSLCVRQESEVIGYVESLEAADRLIRSRVRPPAAPAVILSDEELAELDRQDAEALALGGDPADECSCAECSDDDRADELLELEQGGSWRAPVALLAIGAAALLAPGVAFGQPPQTIEDCDPYLDAATNEAGDELWRSCIASLELDVGLEGSVDPDAVAAFQAGEHVPFIEDENAVVHGQSTQVCPIVTPQAQAVIDWHSQRREFLRDRLSRERTIADKLRAQLRKERAA